jgi:hypothetical protein
MATARTARTVHLTAGAPCYPSRFRSALFVVVIVVGALAFIGRLPCEI